MKSLAVSMVILLVIGILVLVLAVSFFSKAQNLPPLPFQSDQARFIRYATCVLAKAANGCDSQQVKNIILDVDQNGNKITCASTCTQNSLTVKINNPISFTSGQINAYASPEWVCSCNFIEQAVWCFQHLASCAGFEVGHLFITVDVPTACRLDKQKSGNCIIGPSESEIYGYQPSGQTCQLIYGDNDYLFNGPVVVGPTPFVGVQSIGSLPSPDKRFASAIYVPTTSQQINCQPAAPQSSPKLPGTQINIPTFSQKWGGTLLYSCAFDGSANKDSGYYTITALPTDGRSQCQALYISPTSTSGQQTQLTLSYGYNANCPSGAGVQCWYGTLKDQFGNPIKGATIHWAVEYNTIFGNSAGHKTSQDSSQKIPTITDSNGNYAIDYNPYGLISICSTSIIVWFDGDSNYLPAISSIPTDPSNNCKATNSQYGQDWNVVGFIENGLPSGTSWTVELNNVQKSGSEPAIVYFDVPPENLQWSVVNIPSSYTASPQSGTLNIPTQTVQQITFTK